MLNNKTQFAYFDLDGTILNSNKEITSETLNAINMLRNNNWKIGLATGRPPYMIKKEFDLVKPNLPTITANGALIAGDNLNFEKPLEMTYLNKEISSVVFNYLVKMNVTFLVNTNNAHFFIEKDKNKSYWLNWLRKTIKERKTTQKWKLQKIDSSFNIDKVNVLKFLIIPDQNANQILKPLKNFLKDVQQTLKDKTEITWLPSMENVLDIFNGKVSKGSYISQMEKQKLIDPKKLVVFGDALNDVALFKVANISVAMENANPKLKKISTYITKSNDKNGVAFFIKERLLNES